MSMEDKIVLVTGANRGIGKALADEALARGAKRVYAGTRRPLTHPDPRLVPLTVDVTDPAQVQAAASEVGSLDILINNAGVMLPDTPFDPAVLERHLAVNLYGAYAMTQALLPALISSRGASREPLVLRRARPVADVHFVLGLESCSVLFDQDSSRRSRCAGRPVSRVLAGPIDTDMTRDLNIPKTSPEAVAKAIFDAVEREVEDIFPDPALRPCRKLGPLDPTRSSSASSRSSCLRPRPRHSTSHLKRRTRRQPKE